MDRHTHYVAAFPARKPLADGRQIAVCLAPVTAAQIVALGVEPSCWGCNAWIQGDDRPDPPPTRRLTRYEQLQELADRGCDTWSEYEGRR